MTNLQNGVKILPKISIPWVGRTNVTDRRQTTDDGQTDGRRHIANMNLSSRSLKTDTHSYWQTETTVNFIATVVVGHFDTDAD